MAEPGAERSLTTNQNSRAAIAVFVAVGTLAAVPLSLFATLFGFFISCYGDYDSDFCTSDTSDWLFVVAIGAPILLMLGGGVLGISRRSWTITIAGAVLCAVLLVVVFGAALVYASQR